MKKIRISAIVLAASVLATLGAAERTGWQHERLEWNRPQPGARSISVTNRVGDIRVRAVESAGFRIIAHLQAPTKTSLPEVLVAERDGVLHIDVQASGDSARADLTILAAPDCAVVLDGGSGLIEVKGMAAAVKATTVSGAIIVRAGGPAVLTSAGGAIDLQLTGSAWQGVTRAETTTGAVEVLLPWQASVDVKMLSAGLMATDFTLEVEPTGSGETKRAHAVVGDGDSALELISGRGSITLRRSFVAPTGAGAERVEKSGPE